MLKRYVLRSKVRLRDVSDEYDLWAAWGSEQDRSWESEREWADARSGVLEPVWKQEENSLWPWGNHHGAIQDRRAVGMGHRLITRKGERRELDLHYETICLVTLNQPTRAQLMIPQRSKIILHIEYYMGCLKGLLILCPRNHFPWIRTLT